MLIGLIDNDEKVVSYEKMPNWRPEYENHTLLMTKMSKTYLWPKRFKNLPFLSTPTFFGHI